MRKITYLSLLALATFGAGEANAQTDAQNLQNGIADAEAVLAKKGVGYPVEDGDARTTLSNAIIAAKDALSSPTAEAVTTLSNAVTAYKSVTTGIQMPEDGKVYTITTVGFKGQRGYMAYNNGQISVTTTTETTNANYPAAAKFVCKTATDGRVLLVNSQGVYVILKANRDSYNSNKGCIAASDTQFETYAPLTIEKMVDDNNLIDGTQADLFGFVVMKGLDANGTMRYVILKNGTTYDRTTAPFWKANNSSTDFSSALLIEETSIAEGELATANQAINEALSSIVNKANTVYAKTGPGYPTADSDARVSLGNAIANAEQALEGTETITGSHFFSVIDSKPAYVNETRNIQLPEDGKAYTITFIGKNGKRLYMNYAESGYTPVVTTETSNANYPMTAKFICRKTSGGKFVFVNNEGKYLAWRNNATVGLNGGKGYVNAYPATANERQCIEFTVAKITHAENGYVQSGSNAELFGFLKATSQRRSDSNNQSGCFIVNLNNNAFDTSREPYFNSGHTSALLIEETDYPNAVSLNNATGIAGIEKIGTFSAPFRTVVPEGVKAYYVSSHDGTTASTTAVEDGMAIPANTGVLLTSTDANINEAVMLPAMAETDADITADNNLLGNSAGEAKDIPTAENAYILTANNGTVAFYLCSETNRTLAMNKSYLVLPSTSEPASLLLDFGTLTGIGSATTVSGNDANAPVYDLSGRRVSNVQKGGLYIKAGKKFIVK